MTHSHTAASFNRIVRILIVILATVTIVFAMADTAIGWVIPFGLVGGVLVAGLLLAFRSPGTHAGYQADSFAGENPLAVTNMSRLRVAGFGGAGLVLMAALVAFSFPLTTVATLVGIAGGAVIALVLIRWRRGHRDALTSPLGDKPPGAF